MERNRSRKRRPRRRRKRPFPMLAVLVGTAFLVVLVFFMLANPQKQEPIVASTAEVTKDWRLVLVNATHRLEQDYEVTLGNIGNYKLDARVVPALQAMLDGAKADGYTLQIYSAYRSVERSRVLYNGKVQEYKNNGYSEEAAQKEAAKWIAPPGTSEHNTGLAVDLISGDYFTKFNDLVYEFDTTKEFEWLSSHCAEYGFVLRYPKEKEAITGITYEPWHYRYVGKETAKIMTQNEICLEEWANTPNKQRLP